MRDLITYSKDVTLLLAEVESKLPDYVIKDEQDKPIGFAITKTPTVRKGNETLSVVRCTTAEVKLLASLTSITVLADIPAIDGLSLEQHGAKLLAAMSKTGRATYDAVHDQSPQTITLPDGTTHTYTPPELIGAFA